MTVDTIQLPSRGADRKVPQGGIGRSQTAGEICGGGAGLGLI